MGVPKVSVAVVTNVPNWNATGRAGWRWAAVALPLVTGCAPFYVPRAGSLSMLEEQGDTHVAASFGNHGASGELTHSPMPNLAVRVGGQFAPTPSYFAAYGGVGPYVAGGIGRAALIFEGGGGYANSTGTSSVTINGSTSTSTEHNQGSFVQGAAVLELGLEADFVAFGLTNRLAIQHMQHAPQSDNVGTADVISWEPFIVTRFGVRTIKLEAQVGMAWPLGWQGDWGVYWPIPRVALGLVWDFNPKRAEREWMERENIDTAPPPPRPAPAPPPEPGPLAIPAPQPPPPVPAPRPSEPPPE